MPQRRLALCGYQPSPAEKAAFLAGGLPFSVPGAPPVRPARAEKRARQPKARPRPFGANCGGKGPAARQGPAGLFECARGKIARPNPMFSCVNTPKPGVFAPERRRARGVFPVWARAARGILCYSMRRACRTKRGKGCAHKAVCGVCAVFGHLRHAGVQPDAGHHQPRLGRQRQGAKRDKPSAGRGPRPFVRLQLHPAHRHAGRALGAVRPRKGQLPPAVPRGGQQPAGRFLQRHPARAAVFAARVGKGGAKRRAGLRHRRALFVLQAAALLFVPHCAAPAGLPEFRRRGRQRGRGRL